MVRDGDKTDFSVKEAGSLYFQNILCVLDDKELKKKLLFETHNTVFTMHPMTRPDPDTLPRFLEWSHLVESHCTIPRECTKGPHLKEK